MNKITETTEEFIKRKNEQFKENNIIKVKDISREGNHFWIRGHGLLCPNLIWMKKYL